MNYIKEAEKFVSQYDMFKYEINDIDLKIAALKEEDGCSAIDTSKEQTGKTYKFSSVTENTAVHVEDLISILIKRRRRLESKVKRIENAMDALDEDQREVITRTVIKRERYYQFTNIIFKSERSCKRIKQIALYKMAKLLFHI